MRLLKYLAIIFAAFVLLSSLAQKMDSERRLETSKRFGISKPYNSTKYNGVIWGWDDQGNFFLLKSDGTLVFTSKKDE